MRNLSELNSKELLARTQTLIAEERRITLLLLEHLEEIQSRRLHNELGFSSLWEFCTQYLGLSEGAAQRRIAAMRLARDIPEAKAALQSGKLSLSNAAKVQSFRQGLKRKGIGAPSDSGNSGNPRSSGSTVHSPEFCDPRELIRKVENLSQRECEARLFELSPEALPRERERIVSATQDREIRLVISAELHEKLQRLKGLLAHARPNATYAELLEYLVNETLPRVERKKGIISKKSTGLAGNSGSGPASESFSTSARPDLDLSSNSGSGSGSGSDKPTDPVTPVTAAAAVIASSADTAEEVGTTMAIAHRARVLPAGKRVHLPAALKRAVFAPSGGRCEFVHDGKRCNSTYRLEIDHIRPLAYGGGHGLDQLRVLCRAHNLQQFEAWRKRGDQPASGRLNPKHNP